MIPDRRREKLEQGAKRSETCRRENLARRHVPDAVDEIVDKTACECGLIRAERGQRSSKIEFSAAFALQGSADVAKSDSRHRNASDEIEAMNEPIGGLAEPPIISSAKLLSPDARHAEHIDRFRRGPRRVGTLCRERGKRAAQAVAGDKERLAGLPALLNGAVDIVSNSIRRHLEAGMGVVRGADEN